MSLSAKIHALQADIDPIKKTEENPFFKSAYFDINGLIEAVQPLLTKHGLIIMQPLSNINGSPALKTIITDTETGETLEDSVIIPPSQDIQKFGASVTYMRRFALQSLLLLQAQDDDGETVVRGPAPKKPVSKAPVAPQPTKLTDADDPFDNMVQDFGGREVLEKITTKPTKDYSNYVTCKTCGVGTHDPKYPQCYKCTNKK